MAAETSQTLDRGLRVLRALAATPGGLSITALAAEIGVNRTVVYSLVATLFPGIFPASFRDMSGAPAVYYEAAAAITTLVLLGQVMELRARSRTSAAIRAQLDLSPKTARILRDAVE